MQKKRLTRKKNKAYQKGYRFERRVMKYYQKLGYYVRRNFASKGAEDLNAMKKVGDHPQVLHIQCKNLKIQRPLSKTEKENLIKLAKQTGGTPIHVYNNSRHKLVFEELKP